MDHMPKSPFKSDYEQEDSIVRILKFPLNTRIFGPVLAVNMFFTLYSR